MRLIDADEIVKVAEHSHEQWSLAMVGADDTRKVNEVFKKQYLCKVVKAVAKNCPTVDAVEVVHGRWEKEFWHPYRCSCCGKTALLEANGEYYCTSNYCPNCGAKMDLKDGEIK